jgi:hypothetical protein
MRIMLNIDFMTNNDENKSILKVFAQGPGETYFRIVTRKGKIKI